MAYTAQALLDEVRLRGMLPNVATIGVQDADILLHANAEMASTIVPLVMSCSEEFFVVTYDIQLIAGVSQYRLPDNNVGARVRNVALLYGNLQTQLARIEPEQVGQYVTGSLGTPAAFFMDGGGLNVLPAPTSSGFLRVRYYARPGQLTTTTSNYRSIASSSYNSTRTILTFSSGSTGTLIPAAGTTYDVIAARTPFDTMVQGVTTAGAGPYTITSSNFPQTIQDGDYVCVRDTSPFLQIPVEVQSLLVQQTLCAVLEQLGDNEKLDPALRRAERLKAQALLLLTPRTDGNPQKMHGLLNAAANSMGWGVR